MIIHLVLLLVGLVILYYGAEFLVAGASKIALSYGVSPLIVGLTVVAFATSAPEFVVSLFATLNGSPSLAVGNIVGSNIANIALIVGAAAIIFRPPDACSVKRPTFRAAAAAAPWATPASSDASSARRIDRTALMNHRARPGPGARAPGARHRAAW